MGTRENFLLIEERIQKAKRFAPDRQKEILLVGVTKGVAADEIREAIGAGLRAVGENRVQEAREKVAIIGSSVAWHMVGHLQRNKVREAVRLFDWIHSVDSFPLAQEIEKEAVKFKKEIPILLQVNLQAKETQFGVREEEAISLARKLLGLKQVRLNGLMTLAPLVEDPEKTRPTFRRLREMREDLEKELQVALPHLSMGMSQDFEVAIEEGSTMVRIGRALFINNTLKRNIP